MYMKEKGEYQFVVVTKIIAPQHLQACTCTFCLQQQRFPCEKHTMS